MANSTTCLHTDYADIVVTSVTSKRNKTKRRPNSSQTATTSCYPGLDT